jgi:uncharacterized protein (TIGR00375 family)
MSLESLWKWAQLKGISVIGTGDFTHPKWLAELKVKLDANYNKIFKLKESYCGQQIPSSCAADVFFILSAEISCIYLKNGKLRKVHIVVLVPDIAAAEKVNRALSGIGNLSSDGRPILGLDAGKLLEIVMDACPDALFIPAHAWTPHFSVFGASSGFDSLEECFGELTPYIYAIETGLSSDPSMNWRLSALDSITLISNSDAHSAPKIGREANIFETDVSFESIRQAVKTKKGFIGTVEFFPEEGKYHYDGHRLCGVNLTPEETLHHNYLCPVCGRRVTVGVMHRVKKLADRPTGFKPPNATPFYSLIPLPEILSEIMKVGVNSKAVGKQYLQLLERLGNELRVLMDTPLEDIRREGSDLLSEAISRMRAGNVHIVPGYDGEYGKVKIFEEVRRKEIRGQTRLF